MKRWTLIVGGLVSLVLASVHATAAADTTFTYQGELSQGGVPANGLYNLDFTLWDALSSGTQMGSEVMFNAFPIVDGRLVVDLDFGASAFDNGKRWLEISINGTELAPRTLLTGSPHSIQTRGILVDGAENITVGAAAQAAVLTVNGPLLSVGPGGGSYSTRNPNNQTASFTMDWSNDVARLRIGGNGPGASGGLDIQRVGNASLLRILHNGQVGVGTIAPFDAKLDVLTSTDNFAVKGVNTSNPGNGVIGHSTPTSGPGIGVLGVSDSPSGYGVFSEGDFGGSGAKFFVQPHPTDPSKQIRFVCLEGNESGTYFRGQSRTERGRAYIDVPEEFRLVTEEEGLTVQVTARGPDAGLWIESSDLYRIVVVGNGEVAFDYFVNGVRRGFADHESIQPNHEYVPSVRGVPFGTQYRPEQRRLLVESGILNPDFTPNEATAARLGWMLREPAPFTQTQQELIHQSGDTK